MMTDALKLSTLIAVVCAVMFLPNQAQAHDGKDTRYRVRARLAGDDGMRAEIDYRERLKGDRLIQRFVVRMKRGTPGDVVEVRVNGKDVGEILLNRRGKGRLKLRKSDIPTNFPRMRAGQTVQVGSISGEFVDRSPKSGSRHAARVRLRTKLTGDSEMTGKAIYRERLKRGRLRRRFKVQVEHATPGDALDVFVNGDMVGQIAVNAKGEGKLDFRRKSMPHSFPSLDLSAVVTVGPLSGTLQKQR